jgi:hypothetical protein
VGDDYATQELLREQGANIPLVSQYNFGTLEDKFHFTIISRAKGQVLRNLIDTSTTIDVSTDNSKPYFPGKKLTDE